MSHISAPVFSSILNKKFDTMADDTQKEDMDTSELPIIEISSDTDNENTSSPLHDTEKEESPDPQTTPKPSITAPVKSSKKKKTLSSGKRKAKRIPCQVCSGRFGTQVNLDLHMKMHWNVFDKMDALFKCIQRKIKDKNLINAECKCSRCTYESRVDEKPYEIAKNFSCCVCGTSFFTASKMSKHMDKHRETYFKMKKLEEENHTLFFERHFPLEGAIVNPKSKDEGSIFNYI